jgi:hypothetical protein
MSSMTRPGGGSALAERVAALEAERLAPVPRAAHAVAIDATDLLLVLEHLQEVARPARGLATSPEVTGAWLRLEAAARSHVRHGAGRHR